MSLDTVDQVLLLTIVAAIVLMLGAIVVFVIELHRTGSTPWTEWYNDRIVPLVRGRRKHA